MEAKGGDSHLQLQAGEGLAINPIKILRPG